MTTQINPPFDDSKPCPGCASQVRGVSAYIHNFLNRCDVTAGRIREGKAMVKLRDMVEYTKLPIVVTVEHSVVTEMADVATLLINAASKMTFDGLTTKWTPEVLDEIEALIPRVAAASDAYADISDVHFADERHCSGGENILRTRSGGSFPGHAAKKENTTYDYTVEVVDTGGDLHHTPCGTNLVIHQYFKDKLADDITFYGKVWCPTCKCNTTWSQWKHGKFKKSTV